MSKKRNDMKNKIFEVAKNHTENEETAMQLTNELCVLLGVSVPLPHESKIENALDKLMIIRGEHPTRVRNPLYGEERQLAKDLVKYVLLSNER